MSILNKFIEKITDYIKVKGEKLKLDIIKNVSKLLAALVAFLFIGVTAFFFIFFASITLGAYLNDILESTYLGYLIITGFYLILVLIFILLMKSKNIQNWLEVLFVKIAQNDDEDE